MLIPSFLTSIGLKTWLIVGVVLVGLTIVGGFMYERKSMQATIAEMQLDSVVDEINIKQQADTIKQRDSDIVEIKDQTKVLYGIIESGRKRERELKSKLDKAASLVGEKDLGKLGENKPELVVPILNKVTRDSQRCIEIASGQPLTEEEKSAVDESTINIHCPNLANPSYKPK